MRKLIFFPLIIIFLLLTPRIASSDENTDKVRELSDKIAQYEQQIKDLQAKSTTLTNQISQYNVQIKLTELKIAQTEEQIALLTGRISTLSNSVDDLSKAFNSRVQETYKIYRVSESPLSFLLSGHITEGLAKYNYLKRIQEADQSLLGRLTKASDTYKSQKDELTDLQQVLGTQKSSLDNQKVAKSQLLSVTQNDEKKYQQLLAEAQAQLAAFQSFTKGASVLSNQTKCDSWGCYYNQRDSQWAYKTIGLSSNTLKDVGCLITSMAMVATHYGKSLKPDEIASNSDPFLGNTAYMIQGTWTVKGITMTRTRVGSNTSALDAELASNKPVIVGIYGGPDHFLVIKRKEGGSYIMNDPFVENGSEVKFTDKYPLSAITVVDRISVN